MKWELIQKGGEHGSKYLLDNRIKISKNAISLGRNFRKLFLIKEKGGFRKSQVMIYINKKRTKMAFESVDDIDKGYVIQNKSFLFVPSLIQRFALPQGIFKAKIDNTRIIADLTKRIKEEV